MSAPSSTWDASFELVPAGGDNLSVGDDAIRTFKGAVSSRLGREHYGLPGDPNAQHGWHVRGSARAYFQATDPTTKPEASGAALDTTVVTGTPDANMDDGRLFVRVTSMASPGDAVLLVWNGSVWVGVMRELARASLQGTLSVGTAVVPPIPMPRACSILKVNAKLLTGPTGAAILIDINKNSASSIFSGETRLTVAAGANAGSTTTFNTANKTLAADDYLTIDIDQVGSIVAGSDLGITIEVRLD